MTKDNFFTKIPNRLFLPNEYNGRLIKEIHNDKLLLIVDFLYTVSTRLDECYFSLELMIKRCGFSLDKHKGKTNDQFKDILCFLKENGFIKSEQDFHSVGVKDLCECELNLFDKNSKGDDINFTILTTKEKDRILGNKEKGYDNLKVLILYCYLKSRVYKRPNGSDILKAGGKAESCYPTYETIQSDIPVSETNIKKYLELLVSLDLIRYKNAGKWYSITDSRKLKMESANTYVLYKEGWEDELNESIKAYKEHFKDVRVFVEGGYVNNNRQLNGEKGALTKLLNMGTATETHKQRLQEIEEIQNGGSVETQRNFERHALLNNENYPNMALSDIYFYLGNIKLGELYQGIEKSLGVVDFENDRYLVEYEYYKWLLINYVPEQHDYYLNCAKIKIEEKANLERRKRVGLSSAKTSCASV